MKEQVGGARVGLKNGGYQFEDQGHPENHVGIGICRNDASVQHAISQRRQGKDKPDQRAGSSDVEQGARGANRRANQDKGAKRADQRRSGDEERIAGVDVMPPAGEIMGELMCEKYDKKREREWQSAKKKRGMEVSEAEGLEESVEGCSLIVSVSGGEMRARDKRGEQS